MTRRRIYIQKNDEDQVTDLWLELEDSTMSDPYINLCYNGENGKEIIISLTPATAARMINGLDGLLKHCYEPIIDYIAEPNDKVSDN